MPNTYFRIATVSLSTTSASIDFTSIPQTYTDLKLVVSSRTSASAVYEELTITINGVNTNLATKYLYGLSGTTVGSGGYTTGVYRGTVAASTAATATASFFGNSEVYIPNYTDATIPKSISGDGVAVTNSATGGVLIIGAAVNASNSAITSVGFTSPSGANFVAYTKATLYGILKY